MELPNKATLERWMDAASVPQEDRASLVAIVEQGGEKAAAVVRQLRSKLTAAPMHKPAPPTQKL